MEYYTVNAKCSSQQVPVTWPRAAAHASSLTNYRRCEDVPTLRPRLLVSEAQITVAIRASQAIQMNRCAVTLLDDQTAKRSYFKQFGSAEGFERAMPYLLNKSEGNRLSFIVRPYPHHGCAYVQLDDLDGEAIEKVKPISCLIIETSRESYQSWVLLNSTDTKLAQRLKASFQSDRRASGATRWPGTRNFKPKHKQLDGSYPIIQIVHSVPGLIIGSDDIDKLGVLPVANMDTMERSHDIQAQPARLVVTRREGVQPRNWPRYDIALARALKGNGQGGFDRSKADFNWCMTAYDWGWSVDAIIVKLLEVSEKAREKGVTYAKRTAQYAAQCVNARRESVEGIH